MQQTPKPQLLAVEALAARDAVYRYSGTSIRRVLNLGFGTGDESGSLAEVFNAPIYAIDIRYPENRSADSRVRYVVADGRLLPFPPGSFDVVYCFHVLEHISRPQFVVAEMRRVLRPGGLVFIGVPNRSRLVGYLGSHDAGWLERIVWNLKDYRMRLAGRFRNEHGAHAGFTASELYALLSTKFAHVVPVHWIYYSRKYPNASRILRLAGRFERTFLPSVYVVCY